VPRLLDEGVSEDDIHQLLVVNPARLLAPGVGHAEGGSSR
jgi:predicted metal-dependent phosphotriesterase family hydrolase